MSTVPVEQQSGQMGQFTKIVAWGGFIASGGLCVFDFTTSVTGVRLILGGGDSPIAIFMPVIFALLAICFNGLSAFMFRYYMRHGFTGFTPTVTSIMWMFFVAYDFISSGVGMLDTYSTVRITSWSAVVEGMEQLGSAASFFVIVMALLLSFGPFLACMFYQLATSND